MLCSVANLGILILNLTSLNYSRFQILIISSHLHRNGSCLRRATRCLSLKRSSSLGHLSERTAATSTIAFPATPGRRPPAPVPAITTTLRCSTRSVPTKRLRKGRSVLFCCNPLGASTLQMTLYLSSHVHVWIFNLPIREKFSYLIYT